MSDSSVAAPNAGGAPKVSKISEAIIRIAGQERGVLLSSLREIGA